MRPRWRRAPSARHRPRGRLGRPEDARRAEACGPSAVSRSRSERTAVVRSTARSRRRGRQSEDAPSFGSAVAALPVLERPRERRPEHQSGAAAARARRGSAQRAHPGASPRGTDDVGAPGHDAGVAGAADRGGAQGPLGSLEEPAVARGGSGRRVGRTTTRCGSASSCSAARRSPWRWRSSPLCSSATSEPWRSRPVCRRSFNAPPSAWPAGPTEPHLPPHDGLAAVLSIDMASRPSLKSSTLFSGSEKPKERALSREKCRHSERLFGRNAS